MKIKKEKPVQMCWRPTFKDYELLNMLSERLGVTITDIVRLGIRALAQKEGVTA